MSKDLRSTNGCVVIDFEKLSSALPQKFLFVIKFTQAAASVYISIWDESDINYASTQKRKSAQNNLNAFPLLKMHKSGKNMLLIAKTIFLFEQKSKRLRAVTLRCLEASWLKLDWLRERLLIRQSYPLWASKFKIMDPRNRDKFALRKYFDALVVLRGVLKSALIYNRKLIFELDIQKVDLQQLWNACQRCRDFHTSQF